MGTAFLLWIGLSNLIFDINGAPSDVVPTTIENCTWQINSTTMATPITTMAMTTSVEEELSPFHTLYAISYLYYGTIALIMVVVVGLLTSIVTGANDPKKMRPELFMPFVDNECLP